MFRIHDLHHHVLESWAEYSGKGMSVISFDHHTDILPAFLRLTEKNVYPEDAGKNLLNDIPRLRHDEHFDYALKYNIISSAVIISHTPQVTETTSNLQVLYNANFTDDEPINSERRKKYFDRALEDDFLCDFADFFPKQNYILDIDCDYFKTCRSLAPANCTIFRNLMQNAAMITISREDDWIKLLTFEDPSEFTSNFIISQLQKFR